MNQLQIFKNNDFGQMRTIIIENEPWFIGKDVAEALGYVDAFGSLKKHVDDEDKQNCQNSSFESNRGLTIINESGLYSLILSSKLPSAKKFKRWVTNEVLPSIRKKGTYMVGMDALSSDELLLKALQKVENRNDVLYTVTEVSKLIKTNPAYVYELIKAGHIQVLKLGSYKIRKSTLDSFLEKYEGYDLTNPHEVKKLEFSRSRE